MEQILRSEVQQGLLLFSYGAGGFILRLTCHSGKVPVLFFKVGFLLSFFGNLCATVILRAVARGQGNMGRRFYTPIETGLTSPAYMGATCTISCGFYTAHRT